MLEGGCSCGAQHQPGEFELRDGVLYRYGTSASSSAIRISEFDELKIENEKLRVQLAMRDTRKFLDKVVDFRIIARDMLSNTCEFSFSNVKSVAKIKEVMKIVLYGMSLEHLHQTLEGDEDE